MLANIVKNKGLQMTDKQQAYRSVSFCDAGGAWDAEMGKALSGLQEMALLSELRVSFPNSV